MHPVAEEGDYGWEQCLAVSEKKLLGGFASLALLFVDYCVSYHTSCQAANNDSLGACTTSKGSTGGPLSSVACVHAYLALLFVDCCVSYHTPCQAAKNASLGMCTTSTGSTGEPLSSMCRQRNTVIEEQSRYASLSAKKYSSASEASAS